MKRRMFLLAAVTTLAACVASSDSDNSEKGVIEPAYGHLEPEERLIDGVCYFTYGAESEYEGRTSLAVYTCDGDQEFLDGYWINLYLSEPTCDCDALSEETSAR